MDLVKHVPVSLQYRLNTNRPIGHTLLSNIFSVGKINWSTCRGRKSNNIYLSSEEEEVIPGSEEQSKWKKQTSSHMMIG
jgi:hypothetical protein